ncbi:hypothetical protein [Caudoviricetes sp.]|nr:hypothetical protein [Caudoviricetes sp.]
MAKKVEVVEEVPVEEVPVEETTVEVVEVGSDGSTFVKSEEFPGRILEPNTPVRMPFAEEIEGVKFGYQEAVEPTE